MGHRTDRGSLIWDLGGGCVMQMDNEINRQGQKASQKGNLSISTVSYLLTFHLLDIIRFSQDKQDVAVL